MDAAFTYSPETGFDLALDGADLARESGLRSAVVLSLFLDRRADNDDLPEGDSNDLRGWWADALTDKPVGSKLWLLRRSKQTDNVAQRAREYAEEALAWLIDDRMVTRVTVQADWVRQGVLGLHVSITLPDGSPFDDVFDFPLNPHSESV